MSSLEYELLLVICYDTNAKALNIGIENDYLLEDGNYGYHGNSCSLYGNLCFRDLILILFMLNCKYSEQDCAKPHSPYETQVVASKIHHHR